MEKKEQPVLKNDLTKEQQIKQDTAFEKEKDAKEKQQRKNNIAEGIIDGVTAIIEAIVD